MPQQREIPHPDGFTGEFQQTLKEELTAAFLKLLHKIGRAVYKGSFIQASCQAPLLIVPPPFDSAHPSINRTPLSWQHPLMNQ